jgi:hypothetical protein
MPIETWLKSLLLLSPPSAVTYVGAGSGKGSWIQLLRDADVSNVSLVEGDDIQFEALQRNAAGRDTWNLARQVVAAESGPAVFYRASSSSESGLLDPGSLKGVWPNIKTRLELRPSAVSLKQLLTSRSGGARWLFVDCLPSLEILRGAGDRLDDVTVLVTRVILDQGALSEPSSTQEAVDRHLEGHGFRRIATDEDRHPALGYSLYTRDEHARNARLEVEIARVTRAAAQLAEQNATKVRQLQQSLSEAERARTEDRAQIQRLQADNAAERQRVEELKSRLDKAESDLVIARAEAASLVDDLHNRLGESRQSLEDAQQAQAAQTQRSEQLKHRLLEQQKLNVAKEAEIENLRARQQASDRHASHLESRLGAIDELSAKFDAYLDAAEQRGDELKRLHAAVTTADARAGAIVEQLERLDSVFARSITQEVQKIVLESGAGAKPTQDLESRFKGTLKSELRNTAKQLESFISIHHYLDAGINLAFHGWPISPDLGWFLIKKIHQENYDVIFDFGSGTSTSLIAKAVEVRESRDKVTATGRKRRTRIVSLEHDPHYLAQTKALLEAHGLGGAVELVHAPLTHWTDGAQIYRYYDCESVLSDVAARLAKRRGKILALVDGPPADTCALARYPAVPHLFKKLARHRIDVILDDASRGEEKRIIETAEQHP